MRDATGAGGATEPRWLSRQPVASQPDTTDRQLTAALHPNAQCDGLTSIEPGLPPFFALKMRGWQWMKINQHRKATK